MYFMKRLLSVLFTSFICTYTFSQDRSIDVLHYQFQVTLTDESDTIKGVAKIKMRYLKPTTQFSIDLKNISQGKGMHVTIISGPSLKSYTHADNKIKFILGKNYHTGDTAEFMISYEGIPADGLIIAKNKYGRRTFFSDNWPNRAHNWLPCVDDVADKASVEFVITAPHQYQVVSNGMQTEETNLPAGNKLTRWYETIPLPTKIMVIGVAEFAVQWAGNVDGIPVYSWVYPENKKDGFYDYAMAPDILQWFIKNVGPYAYSKLANVQSKTIFGGMENASAIFYSENSVTGDRNAEALIAHEIAHQWFGNMATEKSFAHIWLSEGFATYLTTLYMEQKYGEDTARFLREEDRQKVIHFNMRSTMPVVDSLTHEYMDLLNANSYEKGGWILHMLRRQIGDSLFWKGIRQYYQTYAGKNADSRDAQNVFENVSGKKLDQFFHNWLYEKDQPHININWNYNPVSKTITLDIQQMQKPIYQLPLEIEIKTRNGSSLHTLNLEKQKQTFEIPVKNQPTEIVSDPGINVLATFTTRKSTDQ